MGATTVGPAYSVNEMLDRKNLDIAPAVLSQIRTDTWPKMAKILEGAGFTKTALSAAPAAHILMNACQGG